MRHGRTDSNQTRIVKALRKAGVFVFCTSDVGCGFPDLITNSPYTKKIMFMEIKDGDLPPSRRKLTKAQIAFHSHPAWSKYCIVVKNIEEALIACGVPGYGFGIDQRARTAGLGL